MSATRPRSFIIGCGYVGSRLAKSLIATHDVTGVVGSATSAQRLTAAGIHAMAIDIDRLGARTLRGLENSWLFYLAPPPPEGESDPRLQGFLDTVRERPNVLVYMSTTGVYGDQGGAEIDETTPVKPRTARALRRVSAEEITRVWCTENEVRRVVLRVPGIYGPHRLPLERLRRGEPAVRADAAGINNRIHVDDLVHVCLRAATNSSACGIYSVSDGHPSPQVEFLNCVARLAGLPEPPQISMEEAQLTLSAVQLSFLNESRRISNRRAVRELGLQLRYTDIAHGIAASLREEQEQ
jgi:nucleoside-diphosphate-sugar epimerase